MLRKCMCKEVTSTLSIGKKFLCILCMSMIVSVEPFTHR